MKKVEVDKFFIPESWDKIVRIDIKASGKILLHYKKDNILHHKKYLLSKEKHQ